MQHFGIELLPPSLVHSNMDFAIEGDNIRFGLSSIKGISEKTIEKVKEFQKEHADKFDVFESAKEAGLNIGALSALIQAGCLDKFAKTRTLLVYEAQVWNKLSPKEKQIAKTLGLKFNFSVARIVKAMNAELKDEKSKPLIKDTRMATLKKSTLPYKKIYEQNSIAELLANWWYEKRLLGYVTCTSLLNIFISRKSTLMPVVDILELPDGRKADFVGYMEDDPTMGTSRTAKKSRYAKWMVSDETGTLKVMIFNDSLDHCKLINGKLPKAGDIVIVQGVIKTDGTFFANEIACQQNQIYTKLSDLKDKEDLE
jgi:DNA polymerase III alpha subunit